MQRVLWVCVCAVVALAIGWASAPAFAQFGSGTAAVPDSEPRSTTNEATPAAPKLDCLCVGQGDPSQLAHIKQVLRRPLVGTGLQFNDVPLEQVVASLRDQYNIEILIDTPALDDIGLGSDELVTVDLRNISLQSALRLMLRDLQLTYVVRDDVLRITTPEEAETELSLCIYDVRDLVQGLNEGQSMKELMSVITTCIAHDSWAGSKKGEAEIGSLHPGLLVVAQTQANHEQIGKLLASIRQVRGVNRIGSARTESGDAANFKGSNKPSSAELPARSADQPDGQNDAGEGPLELPAADPGEHNEDFDDLFG